MSNVLLIVCHQRNVSKEFLERELKKARCVALKPSNKGQMKTVQGLIMMALLVVVVSFILWSTVKSFKSEVASITVVNIQHKTGQVILKDQQITPGTCPGDCDGDKIHDAYDICPFKDDQGQGNKDDDDDGIPNACDEDPDEVGELKCKKTMQWSKAWLKRGRYICELKEKKA